MKRRIWVRISKGRERSGLFWATLSCRPIGSDSHSSTSSATVPFFARFNRMKLCTCEKVAENGVFGSRFCCLSTVTVLRRLESRIWRMIRTKSANDKIAGGNAHSAPSHNLYGTHENSIPFLHRDLAAAYFISLSLLNRETCLR